VRYVRNFRPYVDVPWQSVFQTCDRDVLDHFCERHAIEHEWLNKETLRTEQNCQGTAHHPILHERIFFNQAHLFHISSLGPNDAKFLIASYGIQGLPKNAYYGDGQEIAIEDLEEIRASFRRGAVSFDWQRGDVLLLDNMQAAHGRRTFKGRREVIAALLDPFPPINQSSVL
jgi:alpha-ketoglutarate-dependent taurine dioxygenase